MKPHDLIQFSFIMLHSTARREIGVKHIFHLHILEDLIHLPPMLIHYLLKLIIRLTLKGESKSFFVPFFKKIFQKVWGYVTVCSYLGYLSRYLCVFGTCLGTWLHFRQSFVQITSNEGSRQLVGEFDQFLHMYKSIRHQINSAISPTSNGLIK